MNKGKIIYEIETQRTNISPKQFFSHCRRTYEKKTGGKYFWIDSFDLWDNPPIRTNSRNKHEDWDNPQLEICKVLPLEYQYYLEGEYNFIMEWFDGHGYMYLVEYER